MMPRSRTVERRLNSFLEEIPQMWKFYQGLKSYSLKRKCPWRARCNEILLRQAITRYLSPRWAGRCRWWAC
jgi:hypothetical protein